MKVLMVSKSQVTGAYRGKLRALARLGVDLTVITPPRWGKQQFEIQQDSDFKLRVLPCLLSGYTHFHFYVGRIGPIDVDLVHLEEEPWSLVTYQMMRRCVARQKPVIFFTWQNIYKTYPPPFSFFERFTFAHARAAIAGNQEAKEILKRRGFSNPVTVLPQLGVDPELFHKEDTTKLRAELKLDDSFVIGYVGRIVESKGIADLIRAFALIPDTCVLVVVGEGAFRDSAQRLAGELSVGSRLRWVARIPSLSVPKYMSLLDVLVLPSKTTGGWKEQFGHVLIEAMACGTPVLGSDSGEIPHVIGDAGLVFAEGNISELAAQLTMLHGNPSCRATLSQKGHERIRKEFTDDKIAQQTVEIYSDVLATTTSVAESTVALGRPVGMS
jgi:glycosyltransferase involved in cell wall biosynthesis